MPLTTGVTGVLPEANGGTGANNTVGAAGHYLRSNATHYVDAAISAGDVPTLNQSTTGSAATALQMRDTVTSVNNAASPYTVLVADSYIYCDATAGAVVLTLPATSGTGREITVKKIDSSSNACTPTRTGSDVIDGATTVPLTSQYAAAKLIDRATGTWDRTHVNQLGGDVTGASTNNTVSKVNGSTPGNTCTNQFTRSISSSAIGTCATVTSSDVDTTILPSTRNINTIAPITGGGNLTADRTIACATCITGTPTNHGLAVGSATQANGYLAAGTVNQPVLSGGASADPAYAPYTLPATIAAHQTLVATGTTAVVAKTIPDCTDAGGNHLNYAQSTDAYSCGTSSSGGGGSTGTSVTSTTPVTVSTNTTSDQQLMELTLSAGYFNSANQPFLFDGAGVYTTQTAQTPTVTLKLKLCTVSGCGSGTVITLVSIVSTATVAAVTNNNWNIAVLGYTHTTGATGNLEIHGPLVVDLGALTTTADSVFADTNTAVSSNIDLTAALFLDYTIAFSTNAATANTFTQRSGGVMPFAATAAPVTSVSIDGGSAQTGAVALNSKSVFSGSTATNPTFSATPTFSLADVSVKSPVRVEPGALTANVTSITFTNKTAGAKFSIAWTQDATGGRTIAYGASASNTCTVDPTASATTTQFLEVGADGSTVNGVGCKTTSNFAAQGPEMAAPGTPAASTGVSWFDSTNHVLSVKENNSATVSNTVVPDTGATNNFLTAISAAGVISKAQPAFSNLSGSATGAQLPSSAVQNNQVNTGTSAFTLDASGSTVANAVRVPVAAGATSTLNGGFAYDSTNNMLHASQSTADAFIPQFTAVPANNDCVKWVVSGSNYKLSTQGAACGSATSVTSVNTLTGAVTLFNTNAQTATYQALAADFTACKTITVASGTFTITLVASGTQPADGQCIEIVNYGSGVVTVARSGQNINGGTASYVIQSGSAGVANRTRVTSNGTDYFIGGGFTNPMTTAGDVIYAGTTGLPTRLATGTAKQIFTAGTTPAYIDFPDFHYFPLADCVNAVAGSAMDTGATPAAACRAGTNNKGAFLTWGASDTGQVSIGLPLDYDSATNLGVSLQLSSTDATNGHTVIMQVASACYKGDGSVTDDVAFNTAQSFGTVTLNGTASREWKTTLSALTNTGCTAGGILRLQLSRTTDTATNVQIYGIGVTIPRLLTVQAN